MTESMVRQPLSRWFGKRSTELTPKAHHDHPEPVEGWHLNSDVWI